MTGLKAAPAAWFRVFARIFLVMLMAGITAGAAGTLPSPALASSGVERAAPVTERCVDLARAPLHESALGGACVLVEAESEKDPDRVEGRATDLGRERCARYTHPSTAVFEAAVTAGPAASSAPRPTSSRAPAAAAFPLASLARGPPART